MYHYPVTPTLIRSLTSIAVLEHMVYSERVLGLLGHHLLHNISQHHLLHNIGLHHLLHSTGDVAACKQVPRPPGHLRGSLGFLWGLQQCIRYLGSPRPEIKPPLRLGAKSALTHSLSPPGTGIPLTISHLLTCVVGDLHQTSRCH